MSEATHCTTCKCKLGLNEPRYAVRQAFAPPRTPYRFTRLKGIAICTLCVNYQGVSTSIDYYRYTP